MQEVEIQGVARVVFAVTGGGHPSVGFLRPFFLLFLAQKRFLILKGSVAAAYEDIIFACNCLEIPKHIVQGGYGGLSQGKIFIRDHIG